MGRRADIPGSNDHDQKEYIAEEGEGDVREPSVDHECVGRKAVEDTAGGDRIDPTQGSAKDSVCHAFKQSLSRLHAHQKEHKHPNELYNEHEELDDNVRAQP